MIKVTAENRTALRDLDTTFDAIEQLEKLIKVYSQDKPGPAYCFFDNLDASSSKVQFTRSIMVEALTKQRTHLVEYLAKIGIDVSGVSE